MLSDSSLGQIWEGEGPLCEVIGLFSALTPELFRHWTEQAWTVSFQKSTELA